MLLCFLSVLLVCTVEDMYVETLDCFDAKNLAFEHYGSLNLTCKSIEEYIRIIILINLVIGEYSYSISPFINNWFFLNQETINMLKYKN